MDPEGIMLSETSHTNSVWFWFYEESKKKKGQTKYNRYREQAHDCQRGDGN